jgi:hypothetical protein
MDPITYIPNKVWKIVIINLTTTFFFIEWISSLDKEFEHLRTASSEFQTMFMPAQKILDICLCHGFFREMRQEYGLYLRITDPVTVYLQEITIPGYRDIMFLMALRNIPVKTLENRFKVPNLVDIVMGQVLFHSDTDSHLFPEQLPLTLVRRIIDTRKWYHPRVIEVNFTVLARGFSRAIHSCDLTKGYGNRLKFRHGREFRVTQSPYRGDCQDWTNWIQGSPNQTAMVMYKNRFNMAYNPFFAEYPDDWEDQMLSKGIPHLQWYPFGPQR